MPFQFTFCRLKDRPYWEKDLHEMRDELIEDIESKSLISGSYSDPGNFQVEDSSEYYNKLSKVSSESSVTSAPEFKTRSDIIKSQSVGDL